MGRSLFLLATAAGLLCLGLAALPGFGGAPRAVGDDAAERPVVHRNPERGFELHLEAGWRVLEPNAARDVDPEATVVARPGEGSGYLAIEARRLPAVALGLWAAAWDSQGRPGDAIAGRPGVPPGQGRVQSFTTRRLPDGRFVLASEFRRRGGWAYRISRYLPFEAAGAVRDRLARAADGFRMRPDGAAPKERAPAPAAAAAAADRALPDGAIVRDGVWARADVAAALCPPDGWCFALEPDHASFLPEARAVALRDTIHAYRAGLLVLGETTHLDDLSARLHAALAANLRHADGFARLVRDGAVRVTCTSWMPEGASPRNLPLTWLAEGRIVEGQGLAILVGVTGLGLDADRERMERAFEAWRSVPGWCAAGRAAAAQDGIVLAPEHGFRWRLPATWVIEPDPDALGPPEEDALLSARRRGPPPAGGLVPPVRARVYRAHRVAREDGRAEDGGPASPAPPSPLGAGRSIRAERIAAPAGGDRHESAHLCESADGERTWVRITEIPLPEPGRAVRLISCVPAIARTRLGAEQEALHRHFGGPPAGAASHRALRIDGEGVTDTLRGVRFEARRGWIRLLGDPARAVEPRAVVALVRPGGEAHFAVTAERIPGLSVTAWAAYQRVRRPRRLADDRLFVEASEPGTRRKSILATHDGWCLRVDLVLATRASSRALAEGHAMLRSFAIDPAIVAPATPAAGAAQPDPPPDLPRGPSAAGGVWRQRGCPASLAIPPGWRVLPPRERGGALPGAALAALEEPDFGARLALVELDEEDPGAAAAGLVRRLDERLAQWRLETPPHATPRGIEFEGRALVPGAGAGSTLPSRWCVRVQRVGTRIYAVLTWIQGAPLDRDRAVLEAGLDALIAAPAASDGPR